MKIDERLLRVFIPCTEAEAPEVYKLLERAGLTTEGLNYAKGWAGACTGVECYSNATFQSYYNEDNLPTLTLPELRAIVARVHCPHVRYMEFNKETFEKALKANKIVRYKTHFEAVVRCYLEIEKQSFPEQGNAGTK
jgi:hypothetical protein